MIYYATVLLGGSRALLCQVPALSAAVGGIVTGLDLDRNPKQPGQKWPVRSRSEKEGKLHLSIRHALARQIGIENERGPQANKSLIEGKENKGIFGGLKSG